jgi:hypothetical protein
MVRSSAGELVVTAGNPVAPHAPGFSAASASGCRAAGRPLACSWFRSGHCGESQSIAPSAYTSVPPCRSGETGKNPFSQTCKACTIVRITFRPPQAPPSASLLLRHQHRSRGHKRRAPLRSLSCLSYGSWQRYANNWHRVANQFQLPHFAEWSIATRSIMRALR